MMECITRDHNLFTLMLIDGMDISDVLQLPHGDALARCLGTFDATGPTLRPTSPHADLYEFRLLPKDRLLRCTDGLVDYGGSTYGESEENIRALVLGGDHPGIISLELILLANRGGGGDNIGVGMVMVDDL